MARRRSAAQAAHAAPLLCRLGCGQLANPHWEQLCSRCFYFNALAPALALEISGNSEDDKYEAWAEQNQRREREDAEQSPDASKDRFPKPVPTFLLCVVTLQICIFCFTLVANGGPEPLTAGTIGPSFATLYRCGGLQLSGQKQVWRLFTSMFLHAGVLHLTSNLLVIWIVGGAIELLWGLNWAMVLYVLSGLGGALLSASLSSPGSLTVGASGCVHGFLAVASCDPAVARHLAWAVPAAFQRHCRCRWQVLVFILIVSLVTGLFFPQIDSWAHLGGTVAGVAVRAARPTAGAAASRRWQWMARGAKMLAVMVGLGGASLCIYLLSCSSCYQPPGQIADVLM